MNCRERAETNERQAAARGNAGSQVDTPEKLVETPEAGSSLLALGGLGLAGIAMLGWICALAWVAWHLVSWLLF
ncbi:RNA-binding protein [Bradyrhizobium sp. 159]|uniref:RNA-binding protein n=1 Tax=unclassified Bradyrhizobium TaxID=2631580 RepID=UPI001FF83C29|nr:MULTISPECIES: RNA-binding protein [unclassified Bradyrhizobium]MCK1619607.1 RNA-binding protein [Bradyrhizobium sp. 159]MCK1669973.1 RNA-binding protein [Bradyrhizobium sp. 153]